MAQSDFVKIVGGVVIGVVAAAGVVALLFGSGDTDTSIFLTQTGAACTLTYKDSDVHAAKNKKVTWKVNNSCTTEQRIILGNFRRNSDQSSAENCANPTDGSIPYPFTKGETSPEERTVVAPPGQTTGDGINPGLGDRELKVKNKNEVVQVYYFDVCLGSRKADPRLIVAR